MPASRPAAPRSAAGWLTAAALCVAAEGVHAQRVACESREYRYRFCAVAGDVEAARLVEQRSRSACIEGRTWGWDRRGIWVDGGCDGVFDVSLLATRPDARPAGDDLLTCESRDFQYAFCLAPVTIVQAELAEQRSRSSCIEGRTWGWRANGIWVSGGCEADFRIRTAAPALAPPPPQQGLLYCESRDYAYTFCPTGRLRSAELVTQRSQSACVFGQTWGYQNDGVWVDRGCAAEFAIRPR